VFARCGLSAMVARMNTRLKPVCGSIASLELQYFLVFVDCVRHLD
jgi:hypothetical protein